MTPQMGFPKGGTPFGGVWSSAPVRLVLSLTLLSLLAAAILWKITPDPVPAVRHWPISPVLLDRDGALIHARLSADEEWSLPIPLSEMGDWLPRVLVAVEDKRFYRHFGVDPLALVRATGQNIYAGRVVSGASTISSQLVRLSTPRQRTFSTKALEFVGALKLERSLSKAEILEYYLNRAPFGGPIRGVEAASRLYFGKRAGELSLGEAALLVGLLKGPTAYRPDRNPGAALRRRQMIINKVAEQTAMPAAMRDLALAEPLPDFRPSMPARAWHFADVVFRELPLSGGVVHSTLDMRAQTDLERILREHLQGLGDDLTAAGVVVKNAGAAVIAYVGNARFDPAAGKHWVDCAIAPRSPGSTLKPFVYLAAMESGRIIPATLLADTPLRLGGEAPRNFDRRHRGPVSAHTALADSLNVPAVRVLRMLGVREALAVLRGAGFSFLSRSEAEYGDSLILGAGEVSVLELARAYTTLANLGFDRPLALRRSIADGRQIYSPAASWLIAEILKDPGRLPFPAQVARDAPPVAFKTGTSFGLRDAWTAAYTPDYTVVVWFGRAGGGSDPALVGLSLAAPAAIQMLRSLQRAGGTPPLHHARGGQGVVSRTPEGWYAKPEGVGSITVCSLSGAAVSAWCPGSRLAHDIEAVRRTAPCALHVLRGGTIAVYWPPELEDFTRGRFAGEDLSRAAFITSPVPGARYVLPPGGAKHPISLRAEGVAYPVHWYVNGEYLGVQTRPDLPLYWQPKGGEHSLSLLDADDRVAAALVRVTDLNALRPVLQKIERRIEMMPH